MAVKLDGRIVLAAARMMASDICPWFTEGLYSLVPFEVKGLGTLGVTAKSVLLVDYEQLAKWGVLHSAGVLIHEVGHVVRNHAERGAAAVAAGKGKLWNEAGDAEQNDDLIVMKVALPDSPVTPQNMGERYTGKPFATGKLAEEYYALAREADAKKKADEKQKPKPEPKQKPKPKPEEDEKDEQGDDESDDQDGDEGDEEKDGGSEPGEGSGDDDGDGDGDGGEAEGEGSGEGAGDPSDGDGDGDGSGVGHGRCGSCAGNPLPEEPTDEECEGRSPADQHATRQAVAEAVKKAAAAGVGNLPGSLVRWASDFLKPPAVRWQDKLQRIIRKAVAVRQGMTDYVFTRPARRQGGIGYGHGRPILPALRSPVPRVSVWVDTSGSMGSDELDRAVSEVAAILKVATEVEFVASDAKVHTVTKVKRWQDLKDKMVGGGGTDFRPVFAALEKSKPDIIIGITDGMGPAPTEPPKGVAVIWVLVGPSKQKPYGERGPIDWGEFIEVTEVRE